MCTGPFVTCFYDLTMYCEHLSHILLNGYLDIKQICEIINNYIYIYIIWSFEVKLIQPVLFH